ncbi:Hypothetical protein PHPALM_15042 [Phytophthora palmivora]|uniref:Uncharacterized protein n=1 Tax=Phytophthora palmivora TaxID=4796 RepID=A0A2P4XT50_9STRA|nr:Hypothetical protein PHPALM_15042 [Phytophthora palmivora]
MLVSKTNHLKRLLVSEKNKQSSKNKRGLIPSNRCDFLHRYKSLSDICSETLTSDMHKVTRSVEVKISLEIPAIFGLLFHGWTYDSE